MFGQEAAAAVAEGRAQVAALVGAQPEEIVFTSGATESDNLAVRGAARPLAAKGRHIVTTTIEHAAVLEPCRTLERDGNWFLSSLLLVGLQKRFDRGTAGGVAVLHALPTAMRVVRWKSVAGTKRGLSGRANV